MPDPIINTNAYHQHVNDWVNAGSAAFEKLEYEFDYHGPKYFYAGEISVYVDSHFAFGMEVQGQQALADMLDMLRMDGADPGSALVESIEYLLKTTVAFTERGL